VAHAPNEPHPPCADLSAVEARYLLAILDLERAAGPPSQAEVARAVGVSAPTALEMIRRLRGLGFVQPDAMAFTHAGQSAALVLSSRRAAAHTLVHDLLGVDDELSRAEAEHLATAVSPALGRRLHAGRGRPARPPHD
jgi:DtxR family transcriptional regulator, Mn-dependent transcriptional regulator